MKVVTSTLDSEKHFYSECTESQEEWANSIDASYEVYEGFHVRDATLEWGRFACFHEALRLADEGETVLYLSPSIYIMGTINEKDLVSETNKINFLSDPDFFTLDFMYAKKTEEILEALEFCLSFADTPGSGPEFGIQVLEKTFPTFLAPRSRKGLVSLVKQKNFRESELKSITWKEGSSGESFFVIDSEKTKKDDYSYLIGDFSVNLFVSKYIAKEISQEFRGLKEKIHNARRESKEIYRDVLSK